MFRAGFRSKSRPIAPIVVVAGCCLALGGCSRFGFAPQGNAAPDHRSSPADLDAASAMDRDAASFADDLDIGAIAGDVAAGVLVIGDNTDDDLRGQTLDDTVVFEFPDETRGTCADLRADGESYTSVILLKFDLSSFPSHREILGASLGFWVGQSSDAGIEANDGIDVHRLLENWQEGSGCREVGAANWNLRLAGTAWSGAGAQGASRGATAVAGFTGPVAPDSQFALELPADLVEDWYADPESNFGMVIDARSSNGLIVVAREGADGKRPRLAIEYLP